MQLGTPREENLAGSTAGRGAEAPPEWAHNDGVVHGLNPADDMEMSLAGMAHKPWR